MHIDRLHQNIERSSVELVEPLHGLFATEMGFFVIHDNTRVTRLKGCGLVTEVETAIATLDLN
jgi:hypothetical protein